MRDDVNGRHAHQFHPHGCGPPGPHARLTCTSLVVLASANLNTPVALRPSAVRRVRPKMRRVRVTQAMRQEVLDRYAAGDPTRVVAAAVGVSKTTVLAIVKQAGVTRPWGVRK